MIKHYGLPIFLSFIFLICQIPEIQNIVIWKQNFIETKSYWTVFSSSFTHTNYIHLLINSFVLFLIYYSFKVSHRDIIYVILFSLCVISSGLSFFPYNSYAGFSGVLYGIMSFVFLMDASKKSKAALIAFGLLTLKLISDFLMPNNFTSELINATIAKEVHLLGYLSGLFLASCKYLTK